MHSYNVAKVVTAASTRGFLVTITVNKTEQSCAVCAQCD